MIVEKGKRRRTSYFPLACFAKFILLEILAQIKFQAVR